MKDKEFGLYLLMLALAFILGVAAYPFSQWIIHG